MVELETDDIPKKQWISQPLSDSTKDILFLQSFVVGLPNLENLTNKYIHAPLTNPKIDDIFST